MIRAQSLYERSEYIGSGRFRNSHEPFDPLFDDDGRFPAEQFFRLGIIGESIVRLKTGLDMDERPAEELGDALDRDVPAAAYVYDFPSADFLALGRQDVGADHVDDVGEVSRLSAVSGDGHGLAFPLLFDELGYDESVRAFFALARTVDVEISE